MFLRTTMIAASCLMAVAAGCQSGKSTIAMTESDRLQQQAQMIEQKAKVMSGGEKLIAEGEGLKAEGKALQDQGRSVVGARKVAQGEAKISEGEAMIAKAQAMPTEPQRLQQQETATAAGGEAGMRSDSDARGEARTASETQPPTTRPAN